MLIIYTSKDRINSVAGHQAIEKKAKPLVEHKTYEGFAFEEKE